MKKEIYKNCPDLVKKILLISEGWLVGSAPEKLSKGEIPKDYDILVPSRELYQITCALLTHDDLDVCFNTFGGLKYEGKDLTVDFWPEELDHFVKVADPFTYAWNLKRAKLIQNI